MIMSWKYIGMDLAAFQRRHGISSSKTFTYYCCLVLILLTVSIVRTEAMTISRNELSQLFDGFLDDLEKRGTSKTTLPAESNHSDQAESGVDAQDDPLPDSSTDVEAHADTQVENAPAPTTLTQKLERILQRINRVEAKFEEYGVTPPAELENAKDADELLAELLHAQHESVENVTMETEADFNRTEIKKDENETRSYDDSADNNTILTANSTVVSAMNASVSMTTNLSRNVSDEGVTESSANSTTTTTRTMTTTTTSQVGSTKESNTHRLNNHQHPRGHHGTSDIYFYGQCEISLNQRLEPLTLARYYNFRGSVNIRQNKMDGATEVLILLYGLSREGPKAHGVFLREYGDLSNGCGQLGSAYDLNSTTGNVSASVGEIAIVTPDESGYAHQYSYDDIDVEFEGVEGIYGRSIVVYEDIDSNSAPIGCCVIGLTTDWWMWL